MEVIQAFDQDALIFIQDFLRFSWLSPIMIFFTYLGEAGIIWLITAVTMLFFKKTRRGAVIMVICTLGAYLINDQVIKELIQRTRPYEVIDNLTILIGEQNSFSFPSGHANSCFAAAFALTMVFGKKGAWAYIPAVIITYTRAYLGVHYVTDLVAGAIVGTILCFAIYKLITFIEIKRGKQLLTAKE